MFEFKGTAAASKEGSGPERRIVDHRNIQDVGRRPFTPMALPEVPQRFKTEDARRPSPPLRSRSNSSALNFSRPNDADDLLPVATSLYRRTPRLSMDRRSLSGGSTHTKGDSLDLFAPKAWMAKGSKLLKRENSKHELTSLRNLDWVEESQEARAHHIIGPPPPPEFRRGRVRSTGDSNAASRFNISEPFNFHHVTHTRPHHVQALDSSNPDDLVSEFSALRASQSSQPGLRGIKAKDIQREDLPPRDALLPDCPSQLPNHHADLPPFHTSRSEGSAPVSSCGPPSPTNIFLVDKLSHPTSSRQMTPGVFMFHNETPPDTTAEPPIPTEFPESLDYATGTWNDGVYDLASPHAVTTDDSADWNRQLPFSMVKTELAPVEEDDETEREEDLILPFTQRHPTPNSGHWYKKSSPSAKSLHRVSDACTQVTGSSQGRSSHPTPPAEESPRGFSTRLEGDDSDSLRGYCMPPARVSEPFTEDPIDDIPVRPRFSRCLSVGPNDMEGFWDMASDAISWSYALGAEGDSNFEWPGWSIHEDDMTVPTGETYQTNDADMDYPNRKSQSDSPSPSRTAIRRSSSVYSRSPSPLLPVHTVPSNLDPPSASSTESSFSGIPEAITPNETKESAMAMKFPTVKHKEWCQPPYVMPNDLECQAVQDDVYHQMYAGDYSEEAPLHMQNVGRIDGSTISNSPRSSRSPISKSSSQESFWCSQAAFNTRRPRNAGSVGSLPDLMPSKNSREKFDFTSDQYTDNLPCVTPSDSPSDSQQTCAAQRRRSPNLAKDAAQNIMLSKVRSAEEPKPMIPASRSRASSDVTSAAQDSSMVPPAPLATGRRMRSGSTASNLSAGGSRGSSNSIPPAHTTSMRNP